ncbi:polysaccharide deacetylase family protein [Nonomuraea roseoviolacea]|uniref:Peptidoglycan/xylan/chitin deacetylase (PgdA/CDA1 family) n=1 Tax=Nonomuraea roseoviolacea subsp. carminata TaxID=160689 RepID=A0ABT1KCL5_9ACTN|nr:polysaccharide deacetylase [Nonomuraea roseoviolacea]MCP2351751.1 peptidoglycan/xylan/chitin deacetylase (PgdA/CDA1 family) [Nonomuraea roseoviolacea subsp. carminata]
MSDSWYGTAAAVATLTFDVDAETPILAQGRGYARHATTMSHQAYGPDVGLPRILAMLDELGVPATFFVPGWVAEQRPGLARSIVDRGHEVAHHSYSHRPPTSMTPEEERADFERGLAVFDAQGIEIAGHRAALWEASWQTAALVAEHGLLYDSSLMGDDRPYRVGTASGDVVELPVHWSLDDWEQYAFLPAPHVGAVIESPAKVLELWRAELDGMRHYRCLFNLCVHPFLSGRPGRAMALRRFIEYALECGDVRFARCRDVARAAAADRSLLARRPQPPAVDPAVYPE